VTNNLDCDDALFAVAPRRGEVCNGRDDNCKRDDRRRADLLDYYPDLDSEVSGRARRWRSRRALQWRKVTNNTDCTSTRGAPGAPEVCNLIDDNCAAWSTTARRRRRGTSTADGDAMAPGRARDVVLAGRGAATKTPTATTPARGHPAPPRSANGLDDDCVAAPTTATFLNYYVDVDGDGFGAGTATSACAPSPAG